MFSRSFVGFRRFLVTSGNECGHAWPRPIGRGFDVSGLSVLSGRDSSHVGRCMLSMYMTDNELEYRDYERVKSLFSDRGFKSLEGNSTISTSYEGGSESHEGSSTLGRGRGKGRWGSRKDDYYMVNVSAHEDESDNCRTAVIWNCGVEFDRPSYMHLLRDHLHISQYAMAELLVMQLLLQTNSHEKSSIKHLCMIEEKDFDNFWHQVTNYPVLSEGEVLGTMQLFLHLKKYNVAWGFFMAYYRHHAQDLEPKNLLLLSKVFKKLPDTVLNVHLLSAGLEVAIALKDTHMQLKLWEELWGHQLSLLKFVFQNPHIFHVEANISPFREHSTLLDETKLPLYYINTDHLVDFLLPLSRIYASSDETPFFAYQLKLLKHLVKFSPSHQDQLNAEFSNQPILLQFIQMFSYSSKCKNSSLRSIQNPSNDTSIHPQNSEMNCKEFIMSTLSNLQFYVNTPYILDHIVNARLIENDIVLLSFIYQWALLYEFNLPVITRNRYMLFFEHHPQVVIEIYNDLAISLCPSVANISTYRILLKAVRELKSIECSEKILTFIIKSKLGQEIERTALKSHLLISMETENIQQVLKTAHLIGIYQFQMYTQSVRPLLEKYLKPYGLTPPHESEVNIKI